MNPGTLAQSIMAPVRIRTVSLNCGQPGRLSAADKRFLFRSFNTQQLASDVHTFL